MKYILFFFIFFSAYSISHAMEVTPQKNSELSYATQMCLDGIKNKNILQVKTGLWIGADVNYVDNEGETLFWKACRNTNKTIMSLIGSHEKLNFLAPQHPCGFLPLHCACQMGLTETIEKILIKAPQTINYRCREGKTPLHAAAFMKLDPTSTLQLLLAHDKTNINWQTHIGNTVVHLAVEKKHLQCMTILIQNGAQLTIKNNFQTTSLLSLYSTYRNNLDELNIFLTKNPDIAYQLIHTTDENNNNQFHLCTSTDIFFYDNFKKYLFFLITNNLNIHARNNDNKRAIDLACEKYQNFYKLYSSERLPQLKKVLNNQEHIMHCFLCAIAPYTEYALLKRILKKDLNYISLPKDVKSYIVYFYYVLNIETIIAKKCVQNNNYYDDFIENKNAIKQRLIENPEPHLLWSAS